MNALTICMQIGGICVAIAALVPLVQVAAMVQAASLRWAWRGLTLVIVFCIVGAAVSVVDKIGTPVGAGDVAASIPRLFGPCFVFAVAWLSGKTAKDLRSFSLLKEIAFVDFLTGLANRRAVEARLSEDIQRCRSENLALSILLIDIDHFKKINDLHGHDVGDLVLKNVGALLRVNVGSEDFAGRFGGEEFLIIMPQRNQESAVAVADRLRSIIADVRIFPAGTDPVMITVSVGVATLTALETAASFIRRADLALYTSKHQGRDKVSIADN